MSDLALQWREKRARLGLKGPRAAEWLAAQGIDLPASPNTWTHSQETIAADALLVARLGSAEYFLEDCPAGTTLERLAPALGNGVPGVYPVLREDCAFHLGGDGAHDVLAQVCNVNFAALSLDSHPLIMTLMVGVAVLVVPQSMVRGLGNGAGRCDMAEHRDTAGYRDAPERGDTAERGEMAERGDTAGRGYRIWCDPTFGPYLGESLGTVVIECGGRYTGVSG